MRIRVRSARVIGGVIPAAVILALGLTSAAAAQAPYPQITTQPSLYPAFDAAVPDYVVRCNDATPVNFTVTAPAGTEVNVDNEGPRTGTFTTDVRLKSGQGFPIAVTSGGTGQTHHVRCLPSDLPRSTFQRSGQPQAEWYAIAPANKTNFQPFPPNVSPNYLVLFDGNGVPVWWKKAARTPLDFDVLTNGELAWAALDNSGIEQLRVDGTLLRHVNAVGSGVGLDPHEVLMLPNGNYLVNIARVIPGVTPCGGCPRRSTTRARRRSRPPARWSGRGGLRTTLRCPRSPPLGAMQRISRAPLTPTHQLARTRRRRRDHVLPTSRRRVPRP